MFMKTCGIIGGMSWESSAEYYKLINEQINRKLGGLHSAKIILYSVDFQEIAEYQKNNLWEKSAEVLSNAAKSLEKAGADFVMIATNTMHKVADKVKSSISIPLLDIRDSLIEEIKAKNLKNVLLLGTKFTMEDCFYVDYLKKRGVDVVVPESQDREIIHKVIFDELCLGVTKDSSKKEFLKIIEKYETEGVILGCTEIGMLISQKDTSKTILDTTKIHCNFAVKIMCQ
ncbi:aspartate/glutamate racemase family protein [Caminibacter pacificus]|uniref:Aspartate/glutamate racemase family protein n=2 Tax=Caminibacter pacificus TaxID=1424653 RepID=A0ABX5TMC5_9BACT|nr:aspartate/glutamate racemase family protein [Caminibacter pacificus]